MFGASRISRALICPHRRVIEILTEGSADANTLLLLDDSIASLAAPLRVCLDQLFRATAYHDAPVARGIYLCGKDSSETDLLGQVAGTAFLAAAGLAAGFLAGAAFLAAFFTAFFTATSVTSSFFP